MLQTFHPGAAAPPRREVGCHLTAFATLRVASEDLPGLRRQITNRETLPPNLTKHFDEQTVVALAALAQALRDFGLAAADFRDWGVLAAPRFIGRLAMASGLQRFAAEGVWGISPYLVPHRSLHSLPGTVSLALKAHGLNLGIGGGPGGEAEAFLTAATLLADGRLPGLWLILTGWHPEFAPDPQSLTSPGAVCTGVALALTTTRPARPAPRLRVVPGCEGGGAGAAADGFSLESFRAALAEPAAGGATTRAWRLEPGGALELERPAA